MHQPVKARNTTKAQGTSRVVKPTLDVTRDSGLVCLVNLAGIHGVSVEPEQLRHKLALEGSLFTEVDILRGANELGLKAKAADSNYGHIQKLPLPLIAGLKDGNFMIVAKQDKDRILVLLPDNTSPTVITVAEFKAIWSERVVLFASRLGKTQNKKFGFRWFLPTIIKYRKTLLEVLLATFILQIFGVIAPIITQVVIDKVIVHNSLSTLYVLAIGLAIIAIFEMMLGIAKNIVFNHTTNRIDVILGARLFRHLFSLPLRYFETRRVGDTTARITELENIRKFLSGTPLTTLVDTAFISIYIAVMLYYSPILTLVILAALPVFATLSIVITPLFKQRLDDKFDAGAESQSYMVESVTGVQTIKSFALEPIVQKRWEGLLANYVGASFRSSVLSGNASAMGQFVQRCLDLALLFFGAQLVLSGNLTLGGLIAFRMLSGRVSGPILRLVQTWQDFQQTGISIKRLGDIFNSYAEPTLDSTKTRLPAIKGYIEFDKVSYRYSPDAHDVVKDVSFSIPAGRIIGIVGRSGSGKSTLSKLIQRLYIPQSGKILVDGINIASTDPTWLRRQIGVVLQENFLFNATVRENICIHVPNATAEQVVNVAKAAGAHDFILELSDGYDTVIGEKGAGLSGGQKQRIAIARALINNPKILIFDEATSALDYESESIIQKNLQTICKGRTVLIIAHRLSTLKDADIIMSMDRGSLIEFGQPQKLLASKGLYRYLYDQQGVKA